MDVLGSRPPTVAVYVIPVNWPLAAPMRPAAAGSMCVKRIVTVVIKHLIQVDPAETAATIIHLSYMYEHGNGDVGSLYNTILCDQQCRRLCCVLPGEVPHLPTSSES
jgi:hypothetical protein